MKKKHVLFLFSITLVISLLIFTQSYSKKNNNTNITSTDTFTTTTDLSDIDNSTFEEAKTNTEMYILLIEQIVSDDDYDVKVARDGESLLIEIDSTLTEKEISFLKVHLDTIDDNYEIYSDKDYITNIQITTQNDIFNLILEENGS